MSLDWKGNEAIKNMESAIKQGMNQTLSESSVHAKENHPWQNRTGTLEGSIRPVAPAQKRGNEFVGLWGSTDVEYALALELGTVKMPAYPYLRPAADAVYPKLKENIKRAFDGKGTKVSRETITLSNGREIEGFRPI